jgi:type I restriction enzyme S subunit
MIHTLKPYPAYKDSGVSWLGKVPEHWEVRRLKNTSYRIMGQSPPSEDCSSEPIGLPFLQGCAEFGQIHPYPKQFCRRPMKLAPIGSILISVRAPVGRLNVADQEYGIGRGLCAILTFENLLYKNFAIYALLASVDSLVMSSTGSTYDAVSVNDIGTQLLPLPPLPEQTAIVRFLEYMDRRIKRYINAKQKMIKLLSEYNQALIHQAVTGKIDVRTGKPYPSYKDSGVEWLGKVPEHWEVRRLKQLCTRSAIYGANVPAEQYSNTGTRFIRTTDITESGELKKSGVFLPTELVKDYLLENGDLLLSRSGTIGRSFLFDENRHGQCAYAGYLVRFVPNKKVVPKYIFRFTQTTAFDGFLKAIAISSTIENVNGEKYANCLFPLPPLPEQTAIVEYLDAQTEKIDTAVATARKEIELLREYRERLIADVVTGKVDVRGMAERLPEEAEEDIIDDGAEQAVFNEEDETTSEAENELKEETSTEDEL